MPHTKSPRRQTPSKTKHRQLLLEELACSRQEIEKLNLEAFDLRKNLEQSHDAYMELYEFAPILYVTFNPKGLVLDMNLKGLGALGMPHGEVIRRPFFSFIHPEDQEIFTLHLERCLATETEVISELRLLVNQGRRTIPVQLTSVRTLHSRQHVNVLPTVIIDISERKKIEDELRQREQELAEKRKMEAIGRLAGGVAHDFNNLITGILGLAKDIREELAGENRFQDDLSHVMQACEHAFHLTRQLLAFSRRQVIQPVVVDLNLSVKKIEGLLRRLLGEDIELQTQLCPGPATMKGDEGQLEQILTNLLINARDAMPKGGRIRIETSLIEWGNAESARSPLSVRLRVTDTGVGMDTQTLPHIFEPFFTTKETAKGTGLGLATVYGIVQQTGGHIDVASRPGQGTTFDLYFPYTVEKPQGDRRQSGARNVRGGSETILLVEDNLIVGNVTRRLLQKCGYHVIMARNGEEAVALCKENAGQLHLLVTDIVMPGMSGVDLAQEVKKLAPEVPVLFMSGYSDDVLARHHISQEGIAFIEKAHLANNLSYRVRQLLDAPAGPTFPKPSSS